MTHHIMGDIETLATKSHKPVLLAIGGVKFDGDQIIDRFQVGIDPEDCERYGLEIEASTVMWWFDAKRDQARKEVLEMGKVDLFAALDGFATWVRETPEPERGSFWGKGATFDNVKVKGAFDAVGLEYPFSYRQDECYRTLANRCKDVEYVQIGTAHNPLSDAESQAVHLQAICKQYAIEL
jgi:hypothetical protein